MKYVFVFFSLIHSGIVQAITDEKAIGQEILITQAENKAIESLQNIIAKKKGTPQEPELHYRLAELYMRRAKSGRFFELAIDPKTRELSSFPIPSETGAQWVRKALEEYSLIEKKWPNFSEMDGVLFNCAFAWQQLGHLNNAKEKYETLTRKYPRSSFIPDAWMALGEIHYQQRKFSQALEALNQLEAHKESRVYTYSLYKAAWAHYNLKQTEQGIEKLKKVLALNPPDSEQSNLRSRQNLRREALRDLALFVSDITKPEKIYEFFEPLTTREELGQAILNTAKLYKTHGRQKDLLYILSEFSKLDPLHQAVVDSYVLSAETSEEMKDRNQVIEQYNLAAQFCQPGSDWRKMHTIEIQDAACREGFFKSAQAMAAKWWGIWEKNKNHREFSQLTEKMLRLILSAEDRQDPQYKTRFALAELLFNTENYLNASREYERVGKESKDENLRHDANYASILALDKAIEKDPSLKITSEQKRLARSYLDAHPKGEHAESVALKLAVLEYNDGNFVESLKLATPLTKSSHPRYKTGAEDLILEDLARKKDYTNIEKFTSSILSSSPPQERVKKITEIREQAAFAKIISEEKLPLQEKARLLEEYASKFPQSPLAPDAVAEALSLQLSLGHLPAAHRLAKKLWTDWPTDKRADKAREESATLLALLGQMKDAAILLEQISFQSDLEKLELAADFYLLENDYGKARSIYTKLMKDKTRRDRLWTKFASTFRDSQDPEFTKYVISENIEPYASEILVGKVEALLKAGQLKAAFDQAKPFLDDKKPSSARARARLVQAKVLALEFLNQSVKVKDPSRLEQILAYKIDKLDRAQTALLSVTRFGHPASSREAHLQLEAVYSHFIETMKNFPFPEGTDPGVRSALQNQFASILPEFQNKLEASKKILTISQAGEAKDLEEFLLGMETSSPPPPWLPQVTGEVFPQIEHKEKDLSRAQELLSRSETHAEGLLMLSLAAEKKGLLHKALWLVEEAVRRNPDYDMALYQKARLHALLFGFEVAKEHFRKSFVLTKSSPEKSLFSGLLAISDGDFVSTKRDLEKLPENLRYNEAVGLRLVEAELQLGNLSEADKHLKALEKKNPRSAAVLLQRARLEEGYRLSSSEAVRAWEKLLAQLQSSASQEKVKNKIEFLKAKQPRHVGTNN